MFIVFNVLVPEVNYQTNIYGLVKIFVDKSNLHSQQDGIEFHTSKQEIKAFFGANCVMSVNKLPTIKSYWNWQQLIGNESIRNIMARTRFEDILQNLHFSDNTKDDKSEKVKKFRPFIKHFYQSFSNSVSNDDSQNTDEHMVKFNGRSSMKGYV